MQAGDTAELSSGVRDHRQVLEQRDRGDLKVKRTDDRALCGQIGSDATEDLGGGVTEGHADEEREELADKSQVRSLVRWRTPKSSKVQLGHDDGAQVDFIRPVHLDAM